MMFIRNFVGYSTRSVLRLARGCVTCQRSDKWGTTAPKPIKGDFTKCFWSQESIKLHIFTKNGTFYEKFL